MSTRREFFHVVAGAAVASVVPVEAPAKELYGLGAFPSEPLEQFLQQFRAIELEFQSGVGVVELHDVIRVEGFEGGLHQAELDGLYQITEIVKQCYGTQGPDGTLLTPWSIRNKCVRVYGDVPHNRRPIQDLVQIARPGLSNAEFRCTKWDGDWQQEYRLSVPVLVGVRAVYAP